MAPYFVMNRIDMIFQNRFISKYFQTSITFDGFIFHGRNVTKVILVINHKSFISCQLNLEILGNSQIFSINAILTQSIHFNHAQQKYLDNSEFPEHVHCAKSNFVVVCKFTGLAFPKIRPLIKFFRPFFWPWLKSQSCTFSKEQFIYAKLFLFPSKGKEKLDFNFVWLLYCKEVSK